MRTGALIVLAFWLAACDGAPWDPGPDEIAARFWAAVQAGEVERARELSRSGDGDLLGRWQDSFSIDELELGETRRGDRSATVDTSLVTTRGELELRTSFPTHLVRQERSWRVDVSRTRREFAQAAIASAAERVRGAISEGMYELGEALEEGLRELEESLREAMEEEDRKRSL